jgi:hypothetical protein
MRSLPEVLPYQITSRAVVRIFSLYADRTLQALTFVFIQMLALSNRCWVEHDSDSGLLGPTGGESGALLRCVTEVTYLLWPPVQNFGAVQDLAPPGSGH